MKCTFESLRLHPDIITGIREFGSSVPTLFQFQAIPLIMQGKDVIGITRNDDGRTAAFVLPILQHLHQSHLGCIRALILTPARERAEEIHEVIDGLGNHAGIRSVTISDGANMDNQKRSLRGSFEIVVACPGRLLQHVWKGSVRLSGLEILVIDDANLMSEMGYIDDINNILECIPRERQTLLFSGTMSQSVRKLARDIMRVPILVETGGKLPQPGTDGKTPEPLPLKTAILSELLGKDGHRSVLVFTKGQQRAGYAAQLLVRRGYKVTLFRGSLTQGNHAADVPASPIILLAGTHRSSQSINIAALTQVINNDIPDGIIDGGQSDSRIIATGAGPDNIRELEKILAAPLERLTL